MVSLISAAAENAEVNLFRRFALMRHWVEDNIPFANLVDPTDPDKLHHERLGDQLRHAGARRCD